MSNSIALTVANFPPPPRECDILVPIAEVRVISAWVPRIANYQNSPCKARAKTMIVEPSITAQPVSYAIWFAIVGFMGAINWTVIYAINALVFRIVDPGK